MVFRIQGEGSVGVDAAAGQATPGRKFVSSASRRHCDLAETRLPPPLLLPKQSSEDTAHSPEQQHTTTAAPCPRLSSPGGWGAAKLDPTSLVSRSAPIKRVIKCHAT